MRRSTNIPVNAFLTGLIAILTFSAGCKKDKDPELLRFGTFPDTVISLTNLNSQYDDYNAYCLNGSGPVIFSSNRKSNGGQFDLEQGNISFIFDRETGSFEAEARISSDNFLTALITAAQTTGNDFGPYRFFSDGDGYEYLVIASQNGSGDLDLRYLRNRPSFGGNIPSILGPHNLNFLNTSSSEAYFCLDQNHDTVYFCSDKSGNFQIYLQKVSNNSDFAGWFNQGLSTSIAETDSVNSPGNDKCPMVFKNLMVFASDRPGGLGGFDLYYSIFRKGKWSSPVNLGPGINTSSNEYRPMIGYHQDFSNLFLMFSSDRPGGKGGFDLYFTGLTAED